MIWQASCYPCFCSMSTNLWYSKHHSISIVVQYSLTMFYPYLHSTKNSFLTFINQPCCFIRWPTFLQPRHQPKTGPQWSAPIARSWIRWGDLSSKISRDKFFGNKGCVPDEHKNTGAPVVSSYFASGEFKVRELLLAWRIGEIIGTQGKGKGEFRLEPSEISNKSYELHGSFMACGQLHGKLEQTKGRCFRPRRYIPL